MEITDINIRSFIDKEVVLDLVEGVSCEVYPTDNPKRYVVAVYDRRERKPISGSWNLSEEKVKKKLIDILRQFGRD